MTTRLPRLSKQALLALRNSEGELCLTLADDQGKCYLAFFDTKVMDDFMANSFGQQDFMVHPMGGDTIETADYCLVPIGYLH